MKDEHGREYRKRPPRLNVIFSHQPLYFVTMLSWRRQSFFASSDVNQAVINYANKVLLLGVAIGRYVLMPDHIHFFIRITEGNSLGTAIKHFKQDITKVVREKKNGVRVWQPGFFDHLLRNDESYQEKWQYVAENPVRAGLVSSSDLWPYQGEVVVVDRS